MARAEVDDALWENFHTVVNMTSRELRDWLMIQSADEDTESLPEHAGSPLGQRVLEILAKRRVDLTPDDADVMEKVVDKVLSQRSEDLEPTAGDDAWRRRLMNIGHDPLKPV